MSIESAKKVRAEMEAIHQLFDGAVLRLDDVVAEMCLAAAGQRELPGIGEEPELSDAEEAEKARRVYYQDLCYKVARMLEQWGLDHSRIVVGTVDAPSQELLGRLAAALPGQQYRQLERKYCTLEAAARAAVGHLGDMTKADTARKREAQRELRSALGEPVAPGQAAD